MNTTEQIELARKFAGRFQDYESQHHIGAAIDDLIHGTKHGGEECGRTCSDDLSLLARAELALQREEQEHWPSCPALGGAECTCEWHEQQPEDTADYRGDVKEEQQ